MVIVAVERVRLGGDARRQDSRVVKQGSNRIRFVCYKVSYLLEKELKMVV